jgi:hypothetical protein
MEGYTKREVKDARAACKVQGMVGHPTDPNSLGLVHANMITNCPVTKSAVKNANVIFGPDLAGVVHASVGQKVTLLEDPDW